MSEEQTEAAQPVAEVETQTTEQTDAAAKPPEPTPQQVQAMKERFKFKVDGEEYEEEYDLSDKERLRKDLQLAKAAKKRIAEAQEEKRKLYELAKQLENPEALLEKMGDKGLELAEKLLLKKIQGEMLTPEQKKLIEYEKKIAEYEDQQRLAKEQTEAAQQAELEAKYAEHYQKLIIGALEKVNLPKTPELAKRAAALLKKNQDLGLDLDVDDLVAEIKADALSSIGSIFKDASPEQLIDLLGKENAKKIIKHNLDQIKAKQKMGGQTKSLSQASTTQLAPPSKKKYMSFEEWQEANERRIKELGE